MLVEDCPIAELASISNRNGRTHIRHFARSLNINRVEHPATMLGCRNTVCCKVILYGLDFGSAGYKPTGRIGTHRGIIVTFQAGTENPNTDQGTNQNFFHFYNFRKDKIDYKDLRNRVNAAQREKISDIVFFR